MAIYTLIAPALYAFAGTATKAMIYGDDFKDKWFEEMLMSLAISPWGSIPLIADISRVIYMKATGKKVWKVLKQSCLWRYRIYGKKLNRFKYHWQRSYKCSSCHY